MMVEARRRQSIDVFVPVHNAPLQTAARSISSAFESAGSEDAITAVLDGPQPFTPNELALAVGRDPRLIVRQNDHRRGLVANWNHCLTLASRELVHILHADEYVEPDFHEAARSAFERWHDITLFAARSGASSGPWRDASTGGSNERCLRGVDALVQLLGSGKPSAAAFVFRRSSDRFDETLPYCPDEEFFPRLALAGGYVIDGRTLIVAPVHAGHARHDTWRQPDWVPIYVEARLRHPRRRAGNIVSVAERETATAVLRVVAYLVSVGEREVARGHLAQLVEVLPGSRLRPRYQVARALASSPLGTTVLQVRRSVLPL